MKKFGMLVMVMAVLSAAPAFADESTKPAKDGSSSKVPCTAVNNDSGAKATTDSAQGADQDQPQKKNAGQGK